MAGREIDATDSKVVAAFAAIKDSKQPYNWLSYGFVGGKGPKLELVGTGEGGLAEMQHTFTDDRVIFGLLRVLGADVQANVTSTREKFTYISWIGPKVGVMSRAKVGMQSKAVQAFFVGVSLVISVDASTPADIALEALAKRLLACGGAHKPTKYIFGPGAEQEYSLLDILGAAGPRAGFVSSSDKSPTSPSAAPAAAATEEKKEEAAPAAEAVAAD